MDGIVTKYIYGLGLIGEAKLGCFKTYHFDMRGSTVAITDMCGNVIDTSSQNAYANNLSLTVTIDFSQNPELYSAFEKIWKGKGWIFDDMQATYNWKK